MFAISNAPYVSWQPPSQIPVLRINYEVEVVPPELVEIIVHLASYISFRSITGGGDARLSLRSVPAMTSLGTRGHQRETDELYFLLHRNQRHSLLRFYTALPVPLHQPMPFLRLGRRQSPGDHTISWPQSDVRGVSVESGKPCSQEDRSTYPGRCAASHSHPD